MFRGTISTRHLAFGILLSTSLALASSNALALGSTPVTVVNPADIAKSEGIQHPFHQSILCDDGQDFECLGSMTLSNQRAVIELVSGNCNINNGVSLVELALLTVVGGSGGNQDIPIVDRVGIDTSSGKHFISFGGPVRIYADANTQIQAAAFGVGSDLTHLGFVCAVQISGQLIDVP